MPPRATLCDPRNGIHYWISRGPTTPEQLCHCKALRWEQRPDELKVGPPIFVNGVEIGPPLPDLGSFVEAHIVSDQYWEFEATYDVHGGWTFLMVGSDLHDTVQVYAPQYAEAVKKLAEAVAALVEVEGNSEG